MNNTIFGKCEVIKDNSNNDYLAININEKEYSKYQEFMLGKGFDSEVQLKRIRDKGSYHITIINAMEFGSLRKQGFIEQLIAEYNHKEYAFNVDGIGKAEKNNSTAYFTILNNQELQDMRKPFNLSQQDFHMTLGFNPKDVFGVSKKKDSIIFSNQEIDDFLNQSNRPKI